MRLAWTATLTDSSILIIVHRLLRVNAAVVYVVGMCTRRLIICMLVFVYPRSAVTIPGYLRRGSPSGFLINSIIDPEFLVCAILPYYPDGTPQIP